MHVQECIYMRICIFSFALSLFSCPDVRILYFCVYVCDFALFPYVCTCVGVCICVSAILRGKATQSHGRARTHAHTHVGKLRAEYQTQTQTDKQTHSQIHTGPNAFQCMLCKNGVVLELCDAQTEGFDAGTNFWFRAAYPLRQPRA